MADVTVTQPFMGLCYSQVCAHKDVPLDVVEREANRQNPSGTSNGWFLMVEGSEHEPLENQKPVVCQQDPNRIHYMAVC